MKINHKNSLAAITAIVLTTSCQQWPKQSHGGFAEHHIFPNYPIEVLNNQRKMPSLITQEHALRLDSDIARERLDSLILLGAKDCFPASIYRLNLRQNRIERELQGGLPGDASANLLVQRKELTQLRHQVKIVNNQDTCRMNSVDISENQLNKLRDLLNSDNQFALNSDALNPKYTRRLLEAIALLKKAKNVFLHIEGHADRSGQIPTNRTLALARATNVANYLLSYGIARERIKVSASGSNSPYSRLNGAEHYLVNRRVTIQLTQPQSTQRIEGDS